MITLLSFLMATSVIALVLIATDIHCRFVKLAEEKNFWFQKYQMETLITHAYKTEKQK